MFGVTATAFLMWCVPSVSLLVAIEVALGPSKAARPANHVAAPASLVTAEDTVPLHHDAMAVQITVKGSGAAAA